MLAWETLVEAQALRSQGWSISEIARHLGVTRVTVRRYLNGERVPGQRARMVVDPFEEFTEYCRLRLAADPHLWGTTLFLDREAEKSTSVRDNRTNLEEVTAYLGWLLHGWAEQQGTTSRLKTSELRTEIFRYLDQARKDTSLVDALFTDVTHRVWALSSKAQGTFEFDVQPVR